MNKVGIGALAGSLTIILVWLIKLTTGQDVPNEIAQAITVLVTFGTSYLVTEDNERGRHEGPDRDS